MQGLIAPTLGGSKGKQWIEGICYIFQGPRAYIAELTKSHFLMKDTLIYQGLLTLFTTNVR